MTSVWAVDNSSYNTVSEDNTHTHTHTLLPTEGLRRVQRKHKQDEGIQIVFLVTETTEAKKDQIKRLEMTF